MREKEDANMDTMKETNRCEKEVVKEEKSNTFFSLCEGVEKSQETVHAWFNNKMTVLLMHMQYVKHRNPMAMMKTVFFLEEIEHHFIKSKAPRAVRNAFRYLKRYCSVYPNVTKRQCERAFEMIGRVYRAMGYKFNYTPSFTGFRVETREAVRRSVKEIFTPELCAA